ncbi:1,4-alpha-glucan branching protein domain-containing protein [Angustibacter sp. McL0619]|uniref:1,4-alpha-glucan branching protein domain-containing protein n=1 Tax=Angustibacter sp. McL0619 TaxID=3415676 RepID=UPI003CF812BE
MNEVGSFALVLHSHLPWLAHHGRWPVGEEWLYQAWAGSYLPLTRMLGELADVGARDVLTLGVTPVLAAQLDDPACVAAAATWVGMWQARAVELAGRGDPALRDLASREYRAAARAAEQLSTPWRHGGSPVLRSLADAGVVELLGGPATHPFLPLLDERVARFALAAGLADARSRFGAFGGGIWAPECGYSPGLERVYADAGVTHFLADEATLAAAGRSTSAAWRVRGREVAVFGRDLSVTDRIWSSRIGYPTGPEYRDFHAVDEHSGLHLHRVTGSGVPSSGKGRYEPGRAALAVERDAQEFVARVRDRLTEVADRDRRPGLVVAAYDTELFGHWWHEGPAFLARVLRLLPAAGVRLTTLRRALEDGAVRGDIDLPAGSWGAGKDFRVWAGPTVEPLVDEGFWVQRRLLDVLDAERLGRRLLVRRPDLDQLARQALLALSSDWAFMVTRDQAADYAWRRADEHRAAFHRLAELVQRGDRQGATEEAARQRTTDGPFGDLDARTLLRQGS